MPSWGEVLEEISMHSNPLDVTRRKYLKIMNKATGRNVIAYYSCFLQRPSANNSSINDNDKNAFMQTVYGLDKTKGLDLILHTPGGSIAATESIVTYLKSIFRNDIRAFIPQIAMSAGTMIALACKEIVMGKQSNIGPIDPQFGGMSCSGVLDEFKRIREEIKNDPSSVELWKPILNKYIPTFLGDCENAVKWSNEMVTKWLCENMFCNEKDSEQAAQNVVSKLVSHSETFAHDKHYHIEECQSLGIKVVPLESIKDVHPEGCKDLQDCVLTIHHAYMHTLSISTAAKIVENHKGGAMIMNHQPIQQSAP